MSRHTPPIVDTRGRSYERPLFYKAPDYFGRFKKKFFVIQDIIKKEDVMSLDLKTAVIQMRPLPGDIGRNVKVMLAHIARARTEGARLVVFPELCVTGYMLGDRWEHDSFIRDIASANETLREASVGLTVVWGSIRADFDRIGEDGRVRKYNAALIAQNGEWLSNGALTGWMPKTNLPKYRIFDDERHFYPAAKLAAERGLQLEALLKPFVATIDGSDVRLALAVCEDLWEDEYNTKPSRIYSYLTDLLIDISSSPWTAEKWHARDEMLRRRAKDAGCPILYVNIVGLQNNAKNLVWFDGGSCFIDAAGEFRWRPEAHAEGSYLVRLNPDGAMGPVISHTKGTEELHGALIAAMREFLAPFKRIVIGLSGGIDSAVSAALMVEAVGARKILAVNLPSEFNSATTKDLARECAKSLGIEYKVAPIQELYLEERFLLEQAGYENPSGLVLENVQARIRGHVLAGIAACEGGVFTCNGNKTEVALNYFTLYGDGAGACAFLGDLWKGQVYELARFLNERAGRELIPQGIIDIVPSAELSAEQNVEEGKGDPIFYPYHDKLLRAFIERRSDPEMVLEAFMKDSLESYLDCEKGVIAKYFPDTESFVQNLEWAWTQYTIEFKRHQLPPVLIASRRAFGFDRRDTMAPAFLTERYRALRAECLKAAA
jgi:NAD+ synthase (glutamine-hydrolysing)